MVLLIIGIVVAAILGYLFGKRNKKIRTDGEIQFVVEPDDEGNDRVNCVFKVDYDWDVLMNKDYILFNVYKDPRINDLKNKQLNV